MEGNDVRDQLTALTAHKRRRDVVANGQNEDE